MLLMLLYRFSLLAFRGYDNLTRNQDILQKYFTTPVLNWLDYSTYAGVHCLVMSMLTDASSLGSFTSTCSADWTTR